MRHNQDLRMVPSPSPSSSTTQRCSSARTLLNHGRYRLTSSHAFCQRSPCSDWGRPLTDRNSRSGKTCVRYPATWSGCDMGEATKCRRSRRDMNAPAGIASCASDRHGWQSAPAVRVSIDRWGQFVTKTGRMCRLGRETCFIAEFGQLIDSEDSCGHACAISTKRSSPRECSNGIT